MSLLSKLFGSAAAETPEPETHEGFLIFAEPAGDGGSYRIGARIEKEINGDLKTHMMIRADTYGSQDVAVEASISKAKQLIDQQGEAIFR